MLLSLHVKNLALIEEEEITFEDGLNILTGETGAGKSIVIGSVNLALGAKADRTLIRTGCEYALIEMFFSVDNDRQREKLREMGLPEGEDGTLLIKRKIFPGRSTQTIEGESVTIRQLREVSELLVDVYGQRENQKLLQRDAQMEVLDAFAGQEDAALREETAAHYHAWQKLAGQYRSEDLDTAARARETDLLTYEVNEIEGAQLRNGEDEELEARYLVMSNFRRISEAAALAGELTSEEDASASGQIGRALRALNQVAGLDSGLDQIAAQLSDADALLSDFGRALSDYMEELSFDPGEFQAVEERLNLINHLKDKYGGSIPAIRNAMEQKQQRLSDLSDYDGARQRLKARMEEEHEALLTCCRRLSGMRNKAADVFAERLTAELLDLNFPQVDFHVEVSSKEEYVSENGYDRAVFYISMNPGEAPAPLDQIASGGELSRIMLALKTVFAGRDGVHTLVFDEIDSGISGQTAWKVAQKLCRLARDHQILCITHLPQIAAMEDAHYRIEKRTDGVRTQTHIERLDEAGSDGELARLLGGEAAGGTALENAREMKAAARRFREERQAGGKAGA